MKEMLERIWAHVAWADARLGERLIEADDGRGLEEARRLFAHLVASERVWIDRIRDGSSLQPVWPADDAALDVARLLRLAARNAEEVRGILRANTEAGLGRGIPYRTTAGAAFETALGDILLHVALHGAYHRGQVARSLRQAGREPVNTDYVTFLRETGGPAG